MLVSGRSPKMGENTASILSEDSIKVYLTYMKPLKMLFKAHIHQNLNASPNIVRKLSIVSLLTVKIDL